MLTLWKVKQTYGYILKYLSNPVSQIRRKRQERECESKSWEREREMHLWNGVRKEKREKYQRDLCQKYYLREKWFDLFIFQCMQWVLVQCTFHFLPTMGHGLFTSTPLCMVPSAWRAVPPSLLPGAGWSSLLVPPASGLVMQRNKVWKLAWFYSLGFPVFSSLNMYYYFVPGENRINSKRKDHDVRDYLKAL